MVTKIAKFLGKQDLTIHFARSCLTETLAPSKLYLLEQVADRTRRSLRI